MENNKISDWGRNIKMEWRRTDVHLNRNTFFPDIRIMDGVCEKYEWQKRTAVRFCHSTINRSYFLLFHNHLLPVHDVDARRERTEVGLTDFVGDNVQQLSA